ncbi:MAG: hypothetical protein R3E01_27155 [Pirellulaceae bacterium]|nr:hypothetical protein [Planctomycetales bacterium]
MHVATDSISDVPGDDIYDGVDDAADYTIWKDNFGSHVAAVGQTAAYNCHTIVDPLQL